MLYVLHVFLRDSPVVQGNAILALSSLAAVLAKYESNLPADSDGSLGVRSDAEGVEFISVPLCQCHPKRLKCFSRESTLKIQEMKEGDFWGIAPDLGLSVNLFHDK